MRVSWTKGRGLTVLIATVMALQGAGAASAQILQYGYQDQTQPQSYTAQQSQPGVAAQPQTQQPAQRYAYQSQLPSETARQQAAPQYTAMTYFGDESGAAESPPPTPAQDINGQTQAAPTIYQDGSGYQGGCDSGCNYYNTFDRGGGYSHGCYYDNCYGTGCLQSLRWFWSSLVPRWLRPANGT